MVRHSATVLLVLAAASYAHAQSYGQPSAEVLKKYLGINAEDLLPSIEDDPMTPTFRAAKLELKENGGGSFEQGYWGLNVTLLDIGRVPHTLGKLWGHWNLKKKFVCPHGQDECKPKKERGGFGTVYTRDGETVMDDDDLLDVFDEEDFLYMVPSKETFMWPLSKVGQRYHLPLRSPKGKIKLKLLESNPRVFEVQNFMTAEEAGELLGQAKEQAEEEQADDTAIASSSKMNPTSLIDTELSTTLTKRAFDVLRVEYKEDQVDGFHAAKYEEGEAYQARKDYFPVDQSRDFNWNPKKHRGSNRFATMVVQLSETEGGDMVFPRAASTRDQCEAKVEADPSKTADQWKAKLSASCDTRFTVKTNKYKVLLFYSQHPDGELNANATHGGCPVTKGTKWTATLWAWNNPKYSADNAEDYDPNDPELGITFENKLYTGVEVFYVGGDAKEMSMGVIKAKTDSRDKPSIKVNTFDGHTFLARPEGGGDPLAVYTIIQSDGEVQTKPIPDPELQMFMELRKADRPINKALS